MNKHDDEYSEWNEIRFKEFMSNYSRNQPSWGCVWVH